MFGFGHHHNQAPAAPSDPNQIFKIFCRANENYCLTVRDSAVVLAPVNPKDEHQVRSPFLYMPFLLFLYSIGF